MAKHEFGIMKTAPMPNKRYDAYEPEKYNCISVCDELIEPLLDRLSVVDCYWHSLEQAEKGLAYCGITLIPPSSMEQIVSLLEGNAGIDELKALLIKAKAADKFVIHFGI